MADKTILLVEGRIEIDQIHRFVRNSIPENRKVISIEKCVAVDGFHG